MSDDENYIEVNYTSPPGLDWKHSIQFFNKYMNITYMLAPYIPQEKSFGELIKDFFFMLTN